MAAPDREPPWLAGAAFRNSRSPGPFVIRKVATFLSERGK